MELKTIYLLLAIHFVADFVFQTDKMAKGKSSSNWLLTVHVVTYCTVMFWCLMVWNLPWIVPMKTGPWLSLVRLIGGFVLANGACHWATDWCTSRVTSRLWKAQQVHWFFVVIGFDQLLHYVVLFWLARYWIEG